MNSINYINNLSRDEFCNIFGNVFEKTAWIAKKTYGLKPFLNFENFQNSFLCCCCCYYVGDQKNNIQLITMLNNPFALKFLIGH